MGSSPSETDEDGRHWGMMVIRKELGKVGLEFLVPLIGRVVWDRQPDRESMNRIVAGIIKQLETWTEAVRDFGYRYLTTTAKDLVGDLHRSVLQRRKTEKTVEEKRDSRKKTMEPEKHQDDPLVERVKDKLGIDGGGNNTNNGSKSTITTPNRDDEIDGLSPALG